MKDFSNSLHPPMGLLDITYLFNKWSERLGTIEDFKNRSRGSFFSVREEIEHTNSRLFFSSMRSDTFLNKVFLFNNVVVTLYSLMPFVRKDIE